VRGLKNTPGSAVELLDRASIKSVEHKAGIPPHLQKLSADAAALLVETRADEVQLVSPTGDARFPEVLPFFSFAFVPYSTDSAAVYHGRDSDYQVNLRANGTMPSCSATTPQGRCQVTFDRGQQVVTMG